MTGPRTSTPLGADWFDVFLRRTAERAAHRLAPLGSAASLSVPTVSDPAPSSLRISAVSDDRAHIVVEPDDVPPRPSRRIAGTLRLKLGNPPTEGANE